VTSPRYRNFDQADQAGDYGDYGDYDDYDDYDEPKPRNRAGVVIIAIASAVAAVLVISGVAWLLFGKRPQGPSDSTPPSPAAVQLAAAARSYEALASASDKQLNAEEDTYAADEHDNLTAAKAQLRAQVVTERLFDSDLAKIKFPATVEATAQALIRANRARFRVTLRQARAKTLAALQALDSARKAGDAAVEAQAMLIRKELHLPPVPPS
jgi:hypothetical protein